MNRITVFRAAAMAGGTLAILAGGLLAAACGGDDDSDAKTTPPAAAATTVAPTPAPTATPTPAPKLTISDQRARAAVNDTTGVYLTIKNPGVADRLLSAKADPEVAGMTQVHEMVPDGGSMKMQEVKAGIEVPANGTLELKPGGYHIMLMNLKKIPLNAGETIKMDLVFEKAGTISITVPVQDMTASSTPAGGSMASPSATMPAGAMKTPAATTTMAH